MQHHYSPLKKLENLLRVIFLAIGHQQQQHRQQQACESPNGDIENYDPVSVESSKIKMLPPADGKLENVWNIASIMFSGAKIRYFVGSP